MLKVRAHFVFSFFLTQALEIQNLYKIRLQTQQQCSECGYVQTHSYYLLSLPLPIREDPDSLVPFLLCIEIWKWTGRTVQPPTLT